MSAAAVNSGVKDIIFDIKGFRAKSPGSMTHILKKLMDNDRRVKEATAKIR
jgi:hypothetical protein